MLYRQMLENIHKEMTERKQLLTRELADSPRGELNIRTQRGKNYFTIRIPKGGNKKKTERIGITGNKPLVMRLVRKRYLEEAIKRLDRNIKVIETAIAKYVESDEQSVMSELIIRYPELRKGLYKDALSDEEWASDYTPAYGLHGENLKSTSANGIKMRSRGEIIIAGRLDYYHIPYRYEDQYKHPDLDRVPDFKIRRPRDGKIIYWEHFGLVNDDEYMKGTGLKLTEYEVNGIVPWDNLIITYDQIDGGIDVRIIDAMIQGWLL